MQAKCAYIACMDSKQYTIRTVPASVDRALRHRAKTEGKSLNAVAIEALERGLELDAKPKIHTDLNHLIGTWQEDPEFDRAMKDFARIDEEMWK
jgi:plasmid stability protein